MNSLELPSQQSSQNIHMVSSTDNGLVAVNAARLSPNVWSIAKTQETNLNYIKKRK